MSKTNASAGSVSSVTFILKRPNDKEKRKSWSLIKRTRGLGGKATFEKIESPILDTLNDLWNRKVQTFEQLNKQAEDLRNRLARAEKGQPEHIIFNQENYALLGDFENPAPGTYWREVYGRRKRLIDRSTAYYDMRRSIEAVGNLSLVTATPEELEAEIAKRNFPDNKVRRILSKLETLLKFIGRPTEFDKPRPEYGEVRYLSAIEFAQILPHLPSEAIQALAGIAFHSGLRLGEIFAVTPENVGEKTVYVDRQVDIKSTRRPTKTRAKRKAYLLPGGRAWFEKWFQIPVENRDLLRALPFARYVKVACQKAFSTKPSKWCVFHDLRHSYAVFLLQKGVSMSLVAQSLGNSVVVCEKHYTGKELANESIDTIDLRVSEGK